MSPNAEAQLEHARDVIRRFLQDLEEKGIDLLQLPTFEFQAELLDKHENRREYGIDVNVFQSVDEDLLIQLRDLVRRP